MKVMYFWELYKNTLNYTLYIYIFLPFTFFRALMPCYLVLTYVFIGLGVSCALVLMYKVLVLSELILNPNSLFGLTHESRNFLN